MSYFTSPKIVTDNLVMYIDAGNSKSFKGEATTNYYSTPETLTSGRVGTSSGGTYTDYTTGGPNGGMFTRWTNNTGAVGSTAWHWQIDYSNTGLSSGQQLNVSFYARCQNGTVSNITLNTPDGVAINGTLTTEWKRFSAVITYGGDYVTTPFVRINRGNSNTFALGATYDIALIQIEIKTYATPFVVGTRGTTVATGGGFYDLSGNSNHCTVTSTGISTVSTYGGGVACDGSSGYIELPTINNGINRSVDIVYRQINLNGGWGPLWRVSDWKERIFTTSSTIINAAGTYYSIAGPVGDTNTVQICYTIDGLTLRSYRNGSLLSTDTMGGYMNQGTYSYRFGYQCGGATCTNVAVEIYSVKFYNKGLTSTEVLQNFNATKRRYGL